MLFASPPHTAKGILTGQGLVEYALLLALVAIVVIATLSLMGPIIRDVFKTVNGSL